MLSDVNSNKKTHKPYTNDLQGPWKVPGISKTIQYMVWSTDSLTLLLCLLLFTCSSLKCTSFLWAHSLSPFCLSLTSLVSN